MAPLAISAILGFLNVSGWSVTAKHIWVVFTYILYGITYTGTSMPFGSMASVITDKPAERTKLSRSRAFGGMAVGYGYLSLVPMLIWDKDNNPVASGYLIFGIISAVMCIVLYSLLFKLTPERIKQEEKEEEKYKYSEVIKSALKTDHYLELCLLLLVL